jgi:hypothetical protein
MNFRQKWLKGEWAGEISFAVITLIALFLVGMIAVAAALDLLILALFFGLALVMFIAYVSITSVYILDMDVMLIGKLLGTYLCTYLNGTFAKESKDRDGKKMGDYPRARPGLFGFDIVFLLFPIWRGVLVPTSSLVLRVHASRSFTKDKIPLRIDTTVVISLAPDLALLFVRIPLLRDELNLAEPCEVKDNMWNEKEPKEHVRPGTRLTEILLRQSENTILEAVRVTASAYSFEELRGQLRKFEDEVMLYLSRPESILSQAGLLNPDNKPHYLGLGSAAIDCNVEELLPDDELLAAMSKPEIARLEAEAKVTTGKADGKAEGQRIAEIVIATGLDKEMVFAGDVLNNMKGNTTLFAAGETATDVAATLLGKKVLPQPPLSTP